MIEESKTLERRGLAKGLKVWLDVLFFLTLLAAGLILVIWPILSLAGTERFEISVPVGIDESALPFDNVRGVDRIEEVSIERLEQDPGSPGAEAEQAETNGRRGTFIAPGLRMSDAQGKLRFTPSPFGPGLVFWAIALMLISALLYGLLLLRKILATTVEGFPFHPNNPKYLNRLGWIVAATSVFATASQFLFGRWAMAHLREYQLPLSPIVQFYEEWLTCGLLILVLAAIWKEAVRISEEQSLTV